MPRPSWTVLAFTAACALAFLALAPSKTHATHDGDLYNCLDFAAQVLAQAHYLAHPDDQDDLDPDKDGIACNEEPRRPCPCSNQAVPVPTKTPTSSPTPPATSTRTPSITATPPRNLPIPPPTPAPIGPAQSGAPPFTLPTSSVPVSVAGITLIRPPSTGNGGLAR